ncbi:DUF86 domain-containing protein [Sporosarcina trichiuri]|uniref:DUF86 domain-containing protein n=1 Tax=Sporosarcina trichiuri TaxID=3056445 RepID=UPI0025B3D55F|nr:DUF86 domain-containing protein [Sporosarcina sp. 0.2-SM1T-5]WJY27780.1 DUF86 domain-containing protein [Sporosarcina sp. 0.2-SM1T-5]
MYFIDRKKISETLAYMEELLAQFSSESGWQENSLKKLALERIAQSVIESVIDVGNSMIDGFIMRDPGSYDDIIDIMNDEKVIDPDMDRPLKDVIGLRKMLVRDFTHVDLDEVTKTLHGSLPVLKRFPERVLTYLENELGPVSAFLPEESSSDTL